MNRALLVMLLVACSNPVHPPTNDPDLICDPDAGTVTTATVHAQVISVTCLATCHEPGGTAPPSQNMSTPELTQSSSVGMKSPYGTTLDIVEPGNLANSTMWLKLVGGAPAGKRGPNGESVGGPMPMGKVRLEDAKLKLVKDWICSGAYP